MENNNTNLIHNLGAEPKQTQNMKPFIIVIVIALVGGIFSGFVLSKTKGSGTASKTTSNAKVVESVGILDKKTFKDNAEGIMREGGIDGEGSYHLERKKGDKSQNAYLTSSTVDLSQFIGKKVRVWGETFQAEKAGWLMDVGLVEVLQ